MVTPFLLDVNVLLAMHLPGHKDYARVHRWFSRTGADAFATCAITQCGFVRISSQLSVKDWDIQFPETKIALETLTALPGHVYWSSDIDYLNATEHFSARMQGHKQITDAYLLGLALSNRGKLATLDKGVVHLAGSEFAELVELIA